MGTIKKEGEVNMADYYKSIYRLNIKLSKSHYQGTDSYQIDFDTENEMVEWADDNGFHIDAENGDGYSDGFGSWALEDGCLFSKSETKDEKFPQDAEVYDRAYCGAEELKKKVKRQRCYVNVYDDENCNQFYRIETMLGDEIPDCANNGWFLNEYDMDEFIEENESVIEICKDYRGGW